MIIDSNGNGQISCAEAEAVTYLGVNEQGLTDLRGLEEICMWELPFPPEHIWAKNFGSPNIYYTDTCSP